MLQKYFPILEEINSPLAMMAALQFTSESAKIAVSGISNQVLESLLWGEVSSTVTYCKEIEVSVSEFEKARKIAVKELRTLRYRAAMAARSARVVSKLSRQVKAAKRLPVKNSLKGLSGLTIEACRQRAADAQAVTRIAADNFNTAAQAVETAIQGGDIRSIRSAVAALKAAVRTLEVRHIEFKFAREMLAISLARHSA